MPPSRLAVEAGLLLGGSCLWCDGVRREVSKQRSDLSLPAAIRIAQRYRVATPDEAVILGPVVSPHRCARASSAAVWTLSSCARLTCRRQADVARYAVTWHCLARGRGRSPSVSGLGCASAGPQRSRLVQLLSARRSGRETHPVPRHFAAVAAGVAVRRPGGDHRRDLFVGDAELTAAQLGVRGEGDDP